MVVLGSMYNQGVVRTPEGGGRGNSDSDSNSTPLNH